MSPIRRGQVYFADLGPVVALPSGDRSIEIAKRRPVIVLSIDAINRVSDGRPFWIQVVPGTSTRLGDYPTNIRLSALESGPARRDDVSRPPDPFR